MDLVNVRRGTVRVPRRDGIVVRLPLVPEYEGEPGLPSHDAIGVLAHELAQVGESEADFDFDAVAEGLLLALTWHFARRDEMAEIGVDGKGVELASHMLAQGEPDAQFIVPGLIAREQVTLIAGREKLSGKSTLTAYLMGALERDEETVFGPALGRSAKTVWLTEEPDHSLYEKVKRFGLGTGVMIVRNYAFASLSFARKLELLEDLAHRHKAEHVVIDPFSRVAMIEDESGTEPGRRAEEASDFAQRTGLAVTLIHHNRKSSGGAVEDAFRGSTSLTAAMDIISQVDRLKKKGSNVRRLTTWGRVEASNWTKEIALQGATYIGGPDEAGGDALALSEPMTVKDFAAVIAKSPDTARRRLNAMVDAGTATYADGTYSPVPYKNLVQAVA